MKKKNFKCCDCKHYHAGLKKCYMSGIELNPSEKACQKFVKSGDENLLIAYAIAFLIMLMCLLLSFIK